MTARIINQFTDAELAALVRDSIYLQHTTFGNGPDESRFLLVLAVPYGNPDHMDNLRESLESFRELLAADDWEERTIQVYDHQAGQSFGVAAEDLCRGCGDGSIEGGEGSDELCGECSEHAERRRSNRNRGPE
jgi:hypothetical protein